MKILQNIEDLQRLYNNFSLNLVKPDALTSILNRALKTPYLDFYNLSLAYIQNKFASNIRSELGWNNIGRHVKEGSSPIFVVSNIYKAVYIDTETGDKINISELSPEELAKAIELQTIKRQMDSVSQSIEAWFSMSSTEVFDPVVNKEYLLKIKSRSIDSIKSILDSENIPILSYYDLCEYKEILGINKIDFDIIYTALKTITPIEDTVMNLSELLAIIMVNAELKKSTINPELISDITSGIPGRELLKISSLAINLFRSLEKRFELEVDVDTRTLKKAEALYSIIEANELSRRWQECRGQT